MKPKLRSYHEEMHARYGSLAGSAEDYDPQPTHHLVCVPDRASEVRARLEAMQDEQPFRGPEYREGEAILEGIAAMQRRAGSWLQKVGPWFGPPKTREEEEEDMDEYDRMKWDL